MQIPANAIVAVTLMALLTAQRRFATERFWKNPGRVGKILLLGTAVGALIFLASRGVHNGREAYWLERANSEKNTWDDDLVALKNAYQAEPANSYTCFLLGECLRLLSWQANPGYQAQALEAMQWYARSMALDPFYAYAPIRYGMCLDWLDKPKEASPYFDLGSQLDPNSYLVALFEGRHCVELSEYAAAKRWFERALSIYSSDHDRVAERYLAMVNQRIAESEGRPRQ